MTRSLYRWLLLGTVLLTVVALCVCTAGFVAAPAAAAGSVTVERHVGGVVTAVYPGPDYLLWAKGAELEIYSADGADRLGHLLLPELIQGIDVDGNQAYIAAKDGLYVVNIANRAQPSLVKRVGAPPLDELAMVRTVVGVGSHAFVGLSDGGLWTVDLSAAAVDANLAASGVTAVGDTIADAPAHHYVSELYRSGNFLFSVDNASGTPGRPRVWNISNAHEPVALGTINTRADASGVAIVGNYLFISTFYEGLAIYTWNPAQPTSASPVAALAVTGGAYDIAVTADGLKAFLATEMGLVMVNVAQPANPVAVDTEAAPVSYYSRLATRGSLVFAAAGESVLQVYSFTANTLAFARERGMRGSQMAGTLAGTNLFLASYTQGLNRLSVTSASVPAVTGRVATGSIAQAVVMAGSYVVVSDDTSIVVLQPGSLAEVGRLELPGGHRALSLAADTDTVYAAAGHAGVCAVDVSGGAPKLQSCLDTAGEAVGVDRDGTRLYVADSGNGVVVINAADPENMQTLGRYVNAYALDVTVAGTQLYVSDAMQHNGRLLLLNRGPGAGLNFAAQYDTRGFVQDVKVDGSLVYLANEDGLEVLQRLSASSLSGWAWYPSAGGATDVVLIGSYVYLIDGANGLLVLSVTKPSVSPTGTPGSGDDGVKLYLPIVGR